MYCIHKSSYKSSFMIIIVYLSFIDPAPPSSRLGLGPAPLGCSSSAAQLRRGAAEQGELGILGCYAPLWPQAYAQA